MAKQAHFAQLNDSSSRRSYRLGLIDPSTLAPLLIETLCDGVFVDAPSFTLLVPGSRDIPVSLLLDPRFQDGATVGYFACDLEAELEDYVIALPAKIVNWVWNSLSHDLRSGGSRAWIVGYILGALTSLFEEDRALALVGIAHLCFLCALLPSLPLTQLRRALRAVGFYHNEAVRVYRSEVRTLKEQGLGLYRASCAALRDFSHASTPARQEREVA